MKDPDIRAVLRKTELRKYLSDPHSKVVEELRLSPASAQIDIAIINGAFHAYEIKSASDTLNRLPNQVECYSKIFDYITVVTEEKYKDKVLRLTPAWVGVSICLNNKLYRVRTAKRNRSTNGFYITQLLWRDELRLMLLKYNIKFKSYHRNWILSELLAANVNVKKLSESVREQLKCRANWKEGY
jgi:hypothetical protein